MLNARIQLISFCATGYSNDSLFSFKNIFARNLVFQRP
jgi:hypothetical protein